MTDSEIFQEESQAMVIERNMEKRTSHQFKALFLKNLIIQSKQPMTNICQIITPIICILFTILIRDIVMENLTPEQEGFLIKYPTFPFPLNDHTLDHQVSNYVYRDPLQWFLYDFKGKNPIQMEQFLGKCDGQTKPTTGMFKYIPGQLPSRVPFNSSYQKPYLIEAVFPPVFRKPHQEQTVNQAMYESYMFLNNLNEHQMSATRSRDHLADGAIIFNQADNSSLKAVLTINDLRYLRYHRTNGITQIALRTNVSERFMSYFIITEGMMSLMDMLSVSYIKTRTNATVASGFMYMPVKSTFGPFIDMLINSISTVLFPLSLSLLMPVFLYTLVLEKEEKLIQMMRMNGMSMAWYWLNTFIFNLTLSCITSLVFFGFGFFFLDNAFFHGTSYGVLAVILLGWILAQIGLSIFFQVFLSSATAANIIGYLISIWTNLIGATLSMAIYQYPNQFPYFVSLYPTFAFNRIFYLLFSECSADHCVKSFDHISPQMLRCIIVLYASFFVFSIVGMYLHEVVPQQFGVRQPIFFPFSLIKEKLFQKKYANLSQEIEQESENSSQQIQKIDQESIEERNKIRRIQDVSDYPLICANLRKIYNKKKVAVSGLNLVLKDNEIFGLLGPNGAGKTTLISMITGVFSPTQGNAYVGGYSILTDIDKVHLAMGVCPQFDILWPQLSVEEHLYFYARLKGVNSSDQKAMVDAALKEVNLEEFRKFQSRKLSGGMKRRLSVGISLVGNPRIVFLDQPTTGLDPENRRQLWEVLAKLKKKRSLFLTTHSMEEADTLCNRVGIITHGHLRTVGSQLKLKKSYGSGYFLTVNLETTREQVHEYQKLQDCNLEDYDDSSKSVSVMSGEGMINESIGQQMANAITFKRQQNENVRKVKRVVQQMFPQAVLDKEISGFIRYNLGQIQVSEILQKINKADCPQIRQGWAISNSTLEDVFMKVVSKYEEKEESDSDNEQQEGDIPRSPKSKQQHGRVSIQDESEQVEGPPQDKL